MDPLSPNDNYLLRFCQRIERTFNTLGHTTCQFSLRLENCDSRHDSSPFPKLAENRLPRAVPVLLPPRIASAEASVLLLLSSMERGKDMEKLPNDLIVEIFSRLPSKSVARFRTLSKYWDSTLRSQNFAKLFLARSSTRPRLLFAVERYGTWQFFSTPQPQNLYENSSHLDFHSKFSGDVNLFICSYASGLFFFPKVQIENEHAPLISNPVTGLYVRLPQLKYEAECKDSRGFLGFDPIDEQFKAIKPYNDQGILTLGTGELCWKSINTDDYFRALSEGICINGILYYLSSESGEGFVSVPLIVCFDVRSEKYTYINGECFSDQLEPPFGLRLKTTTGFRLVNCKGKLGGIHWKYGDSDGRRTVELYLCVLEDVEKEEWVSYVYTLPENEVLSSCPFTIAGVTATGDIVLVMKFTSKPFYVFYFNPERNSLQSVEIQGLGANLESVENCGQVFAFVDHVEDISVNNAKELKSKVAHITPVCTCGKEEAKKKKKEEEEKKNEEEEENKENEEEEENKEKDEEEENKEKDEVVV